MVKSSMCALHIELENIINKEKNMKKKLAVLLATVASIATIFTGCGKDISGDYVAEVKLADFMEESDLSDMEEMGIDMSDITLDVTLNLTKDNNFTFAFDTTSFKDDFSALINDNMDGIIDQTLEMYGMSREDFTDEVAQASGYDNADAFFEEMKNEMSSAMDQAYEELDKEMEEANVTGTYKVSKNSVTFVSSDEEGVGLDEGTIGSDGSITVVTDYDGQDFTLVFNKQ